MILSYFPINNSFFPQEFVRQRNGGYFWTGIKNETIWKISNRFSNPATHGSKDS